MPTYTVNGPLMVGGTLYQAGQEVELDEAVADGLAPGILTVKEDAPKAAPEPKAEPKAPVKPKAEPEPEETDLGSAADAKSP